jgi:hypothetical protein
MKRCTKCGQYKQKETFPLNPQTKDGYYSWCKKCKRESEAERNKNKVIEKLVRPKICNSCLKQEPEVEFETRAKKLCKICKEQSREKERLRRKVKTKVCKICGKQKGIDKYENSFNKICNKCKIHSNKEQKELLEKWKEKREKDRERRFKYKKEAIEKLGGKCNDCGIKPSEQWPIACFDFHHISDKDALISRLLHKKKIEKEKLEIELNKCIILCSNCHRKRHFREKENRDES